MPAQRILSDDRAHPLRQPVKPAAHVRRLARQPDARPLRPQAVFVQRAQTRQPHHAALSTTATNSRTSSASNPRPTTRLRPFLSRISTRTPPAPRDTLAPRTHPRAPPTNRPSPASNPRPTTRLRPFLSRISPRTSPAARDTLAPCTKPAAPASRAAPARPPPPRATCTSTNFVNGA